MKLNYKLKTNLYSAIKSEDSEYNFSFLFYQVIKQNICSRLEKNLDF